MEQLIKITTIPISIQLKTSKAQLKNSSPEDSFGIPKLSIFHDKGGFKITSDPIKVRIDTLETKKSIGILTAQDSILKSAQDGIKIAYEATARYADEGNYLADTPTSQNPIPEIAKKYFNRDIQTMLAFIPSQEPNISWDGGTLNIQYNADDLNIDWESAHPEFEFIPPNIELTVLERPSVIIEYLGGPIYVPPSVDPNYEPSTFDTMA